MRPGFRIKADNEDITATLRDRLLSLRVTDVSGDASDTLALSLDDRDGRIAWPRHGATLSVALGYESDGMQTVGDFVVDEITHSGPPSTLGVQGKAADMRASLKVPVSVSWDDTTLGEIMAAIAPRHGLKARVFPSLQNERIAHRDQTDESDLHFVTRLARERNAISKITPRFWVVAPKGEAKAFSGVVLPTVPMPLHQMLRHRLTQAERGKYASVRAAWHDTDTGHKRTVLSGQGEPVFAIRHLFPNATEALAAAEAKRHQLDRGNAVLSLTVVGNPQLYAEGTIDVQGLREPIAGRWLITRVEHRLDAQGFVSQVDAELPSS